MLTRRVPLGLAAPVALLALVGALAYLQYQWVGQVSEAERAQLRESLDRRAREFADDFDREIGRAFQAFQFDAAFDPATPDRFGVQYDEWLASAKFPGLVRAAYFAAITTAGVSLSRYSPDTRTFASTEWPAALAPARRHLEMMSRKPASGEEPTVLAINVAPVLPEVPAIVIPETVAVPTNTTHVAVGSSSTAPQAATVVVAFRTANRHIILELDRDYISNQMLPALVEQHFPETGRAQYHVVIVDGVSTPLLSRGVLAGEHLDPSTADARASFFGIRVDMIRRVSSPSLAHVADPSVGATPGTDIAAGEVLPPAAAGRTERFSMVVEQRGSSGSASWTGATGSGWTILLRHSAGSLDAAVAQARRHNLMLSFSILGVLVAGVGLIVINARRSERLAAQQMDFVSTVSHELRTPLAVIRSAAQNLAAGVVREAGQARQYGDLIESEGRRLTDMVEQVLEYSGLSGNRHLPQARPVDAGTVIQEVASASAALPEAAAVQIAVQVPSGLPPLSAEPEGIKRALHNLLANALKYAADGGWIGVTAALGTGRDAGEILITVADRGRGIPAEDLPHVFEPFYRGQYARDRQVHGNGLGLSLVKRIAEAHGGRATVRSSPGQGAEFTLHLPVATDSVDAPVTSPVTDGRPA